MAAWWGTAVVTHTRCWTHTLGAPASEASSIIILVEAAAVDEAKQGLRRPLWDTIKKNASRCLISGCELAQKPASRLFSGFYHTLVCKVSRANNSALSGEIRKVLPNLKFTQRSCDKQVKYHI